MNRLAAWLTWRLAFRLARIVGRRAFREGRPLFRHALREGVPLARLAAREGSVLAWRALQEGLPVVQRTVEDGKAAWSTYQQRRGTGGPALGPRSRYCGQCGSRVVSAVEFCPGCGLLLPAAGNGLAPAVLRPCPACDSPSDPTDFFCTACGAPWSEQARALRPVGQQRPAAVEVAAVLHILAGLAVFFFTVPADLIALLTLSGQAPLQGLPFIEVVLPASVAAGVWGLAWLGFSLAAARGLRRAQPWARTATVAVALLWSLTGIGALVAIPLILGLFLPGANAYFSGRSRRSRPPAVVAEAALPGRVP